MTRLLFVASVSLSLLGCARSTVRDEDDSGAVPSADARVVAVDSGSRRDAGRDAGPLDVRLGAALTCALDADAALAAIVRFIACTESPATVVSMMEAWEAGLLSGLEPSGGLIAGYQGEVGCEAWRCLASASSCDAASVCLAPSGGACEPGSLRCDGDIIVACAMEGDGARRAFDCASLGATCDGGRCNRDGCTFYGDYYQLECQDDALTLCDGAIRMPCEAWAPGSACASFAIGGEVPTQWCSPSRMGVAGAYARAVECVGGALLFESVSTRTYRFDCTANGYSRCAERGCER